MENINFPKCLKCLKEFEFLQTPLYKCNTCEYSNCKSCYYLNKKCPKCRANTFELNYDDSFYFFKLQRKKWEYLMAVMKILKGALINEESEEKLLFKSNIDLIDKILNEPKSTDEISFKDVIKLIKERKSKYKNKLERTIDLMNQFDVFVPITDPKPLDNICTEFLNEPNEFLQKIYMKIKSGEKLLTFHRIKSSDEAKFGKISYLNNTLFFHCLDLNDPEDCTEFIRFRDLKAILSIYWDGKIHFRLFLKMCSKRNIENIVNIRIRDSTVTPQIISLFTMENGVSYKGEYYKVNDGCINIIPAKIDEIGYCSMLLFEYETLKDGEEFYVFKNEGGLRVKRGKFGKEGEICIGVGEVCSYFMEVNESRGKVVDCGFSLKVN